MSTPKVKARARVQVTVEVQLDSTWGDECPVGQVHKQATSEATEYLNRHLSESGRVKILELSARAIITEDE